MKAFYLVAVAVLIGCSTPSPKPAPDPMAPTCADACATLTRLGCDEAKPTPDGATCTEVCNNAGTLPVACITHAASCDDANNCE